MPVVELRRAARRDVRARWLLGVCLAAQGRYGSALDVLEPLADSVGLAAATVASVHRQLGRHAVAQSWDEMALAHESPEAQFDATLGLGADAVGLGDAATASRRLAQAAELARGRRDWWRQRIRLEWLRAEVGLLTGDHSAAVRAARTAISRSEREQAARHLAKSLLFAGVANSDLRDLERCLVVARRLQCRPLVWPALVVRARLDPGRARQHRRAAAAVVRRIAADLPSGMRGEWLARPEFAELPEMFPR